MRYGLLELLAEIHLAGSKQAASQTANLYGLDLLLQDDGAQTRTLLTDGLGSVRQEMAGSTLETTTTYEPYGNVLAQTGRSGTTYGFTGEQFDSSTGLLYLRVRYYNPNLRLFMGRDPWRGSLWRPGSQNGYNYVSGNPVNWLDPTGKCYGPFRYLRQIEGVNCANMDLALSIITNPDASLAQRAGASTYATVMAGSHAMLAVGTAASGGWGQGLVVYTTGYGGYDRIRERIDSPGLTIPGYILGYENIRRDLVTINDPCATTGRKLLAGGDALLNTILGASLLSGLPNSARSVKTAWELRQLDAAERLLFLRQLGAKSGIEVIESSRFYRPLGEKVIEVPASALEGSSWRLAGGYYHEAAHVGQEFGRISVLKGGNLATRLPKGLQLLSTKLERGIGIFVYPLNPVEAQAFASGSAYFSQNVGYTLYNKLFLYGVNRYLVSPDGN